MNNRLTSIWTVCMVVTAGFNYYNNLGQRWDRHSTRMPFGAFDTILWMTEGYQISTLNATKFTFIGDRICI
ncbi:MAG: hypothetical protein JSV56_00955 [Methanomassiliicoccales archaeon]|nr:MAG: hypothetical protein JSV56_00955 [Methanomassiliicoccales archaeon]